MKKKLLAMLTAAAALTVCTAGFAGCGLFEGIESEIGVNSEEISQGVKYVLNSDKTEYSVAGLSSTTETEIVITDNVNGKPVTAINDSAFDNCQEIISVSIPNSVTNVGDKVFRNCSGLTSINLSDGMTRIGSNAFCGSLVVKCEAASKPSGWDNNWDKNGTFGRVTVDWGA